MGLNKPGRLRSKLFKTGSTAKVIGLPFMLIRLGGGYGFYTHAADRIDYRHSLLRYCIHH
jgi:hypothetical protein